MLRLARTLAWLALASATAACASAPANRIAEGHAGAPGVQRVLLCPLNLVVALRPELRPGANPVAREIASYLESQGREVRHLARSEGRELWTRALVKARVDGLLTRAPELFVAELAQDHAFDAVVMPALILLQTRMDANIASWDGVTRRMRMVDLSVVGLSREDGRFSKGRAFGGITGDAWVTSLHVLVYARDGSRAFEGRGGIDFLQEIDFIEPGKSYRYRLRPNGAIFLDRSVLVEAVAKAFTPYLVPPDA